MSKMPESMALLSLSIMMHINPTNDPRIYWAREVTFDYATSSGKRGEWYELKSVIKAKRKDRLYPVSEILLMLFKSATRERSIPHLKWGF